jgi:hypothetical protein
MEHFVVSVASAFIRHIWQKWLQAWSLRKLKSTLLKWFLRM